MNCRPDRLRSYADGELPQEEQASIEAHLGSCDACGRTLSALRERAASVAGRISVNEPAPHETPDPGALWMGIARRLTDDTPDARGVVPTLASVRPMPGRPGRSIPGRPVPDHSARFTRRGPGYRRIVLIAAGAAACLVASISYAPARQVFAEFLSIFRVKELSTVRIDPAALDRLQGLQEAIHSGLLAGPVVERQPGEARTAADPAEAGAKAGFAVRVPASLPDGAVRQELTVTAGPALRLDFDRNQVQAQLEAAGIRDLALTDIPSGSFRIDVPAVVRTVYNVPGPRGDASIELTQVAAPEVSLPPGTDPAALGRCFLQLLGLPPAEAGRLASRIDWTSTLVIPVPKDAAEVREVVVAGAPGILFEQRRGAEGRHPARALLWEKDEVICSLRATDVTPSELLRIAESLR